MLINNARAYFWGINQFYMKTLFQILCFLFPAIMIAQLEGEIIYEDKINVHRRMQNEEFKAMVPEFRTSEMILSFTEEESYYQAYENPDGESEEVEAGPGMRMRMMRANNKIYKNLKEGNKVEEREFMNKKFLIKGEFDPLEWKMTTESRVILEHMCMKALFQDSTRNVEAWFAVDMPVPAGPSRYGQLPGVILELDINEGERILTAKQIDLKELPKDAIKEPTKGKEVTSEEFRELMHERMKEMNAQRGGRDGAIRIMRHD